jgi:hypothetical protein
MREVARRSIPQDLISEGRTMHLRAELSRVYAVTVAVLSAIALLLWVALQPPTG